MNKSVLLNRQLAAFVIPLVMLVVLVTLIQVQLSQTNSDALSLGITTDLLFTVPLIYFLLIRKTTLSGTTVVLIMVLGLLIGTHFLPQRNQNYLDLFKTWALPILELSVLTFVFLKIRKALIRYKAFGVSHDFLTTLKTICQEIVPKGPAALIATEVAVIYYGFVDWKSRRISENEFTYHKHSGTIGVLGAIIFIVLIETFVFHILLIKWSERAAWILSGLSIYTAVQIFGFARSMTKRPIVIDQNKLILRYGILNETEIDFVDIDKIELSNKIEKNKNTRKLSSVGELERHNVIIHLKKENALTGVYGIQRKFKVLALHVDNEVEFKQKMENALKQNA